jgi:PPOX class probable F420-dependent enzyme
LVVNLDEQEALERLRSARVARLATASSNGQSHIVPVSFAVNDRIAVIAVNHMPKTTSNLRRLRNIKENNQVSLLVDEYDDRDWARLWWVRASGRLPSGP